MRIAPRLSVNQDPEELFGENFDNINKVEILGWKKSEPANDVSVNVPDAISSISIDSYDYRVWGSRQEQSGCH